MPAGRPSENIAASERYLRAIARVFQRVLSSGGTVRDYMEAVAFDPELQATTLVFVGARKHDTARLDHG
jgi:hypothetical protein